MHDATRTLETCGLCGGLGPLSTPRTGGVLDDPSLWGGGRYGGPWSDPCPTEAGSDFTRKPGGKRGRMADDSYDI